MFARKLLAGAVAAAVAALGDRAVRRPRLRGRTPTPTTRRFTPGRRRPHRRRLRHQPARAQASSPTAVERQPATRTQPSSRRFAATGGGTIDAARAADDHPARTARVPARRCSTAPATTPTSTSPARPRRRRRRDRGRPAGLPVRPRHPGDGRLEQHARTRPTSLTRPRSSSIYKGDRHATGAEVGGTSRRHRAEDPAGRLGHAQLLRGPAQGRQRRRRGDPRRHRRRGPGARRHARSRTTPNAIAPFSMGRAGLARQHPPASRPASAPTARSTTSSAAADVANADIQASSVRTGSSAPPRPAPLIEAAGFKQLATPDHGGVCGAADPDGDQQLHDSTSVVTTDRPVAATSARRPTRSRLTATVTGSTVADGTVDVPRGRRPLLAADVPAGLRSQAVTHLTGVAAGRPHLRRAVFTADEGSAFRDLELRAADVAVKTGSSVSETFPAQGRARQGKATVDRHGDGDVGATATGQVVGQAGSARPVAKSVTLTARQGDASPCRSSTKGNEQPHGGATPATDDLRRLEARPSRSPRSSSSDLRRPGARSRGGRACATRRTHPR